MLEPPFKCQQENMKFFTSLIIVNKHRSKKWRFWGTHLIQSITHVAPFISPLLSYPSQDAGALTQSPKISTIHVWMKKSRHRQMFCPSTFIQPAGTQHSNLAFPFSFLPKLLLSGLFRRQAWACPNSQCEPHIISAFCICSVCFSASPPAMLQRLWFSSCGVIPVFFHVTHGGG